ncbi:MAG: iron complex transport system ATP-binding protein [Frankiales bacterium]|jgi:iron complex transport system ATP-binding protein|nr:iron complex transport system ATP-binding protein [Frankiales bacterium]
MTSVTDRAQGEVAHLRGVGVGRGEAILLQDVFWRVRAGQRWAVIGANGAGKTTLLQVVAAVTLPTEGTATLLGEPLDEADLDELQTRIGWASAAVADQLAGQTRVLDVVMTAAHASVTRGEEVYEAYDETRARDLLHQLGCRALVDREFGTLSEGERKRVQIARALMTDPELLLLDEPAAGLDLGAREALLRRLSRLARDPNAPSMIMVTHHVEEIPIGFTHALLLKAGKVIAAGPLASVLTAPLLSATFGLPLVVEGREGRWTARLALPMP